MRVLSIVLIGSLIVAYLFFLWKDFRDQPPVYKEEDERQFDAHVQQAMFVARRTP